MGSTDIPIDLCAPQGGGAEQVGQFVMVSEVEHRPIGAAILPLGGGRLFKVDLPSQWSFVGWKPELGPERQRSCR